MYICILGNIKHNSERGAQTGPLAEQCAQWTKFNWTMVRYFPSLIGGDIWLVIFTTVGPLDIRTSLWTLTLGQLFNRHHFIHLPAPSTNQMHFWLSDHYQDSYRCSKTELCFNICCLFLLFSATVKMWHGDMEIFRSSNQFCFGHFLSKLTLEIRLHFCGRLLINQQTSGARDEHLHCFILNLLGSSLITKPINSLLHWKCDSRILDPFFWMMEPADVFVDWSVCSSE